LRPYQSLGLTAGPIPVLNFQDPGAATAVSPSIGGQSSVSSRVGQRPAWLGLARRGWRQNGGQEVIGNCVMRLIPAGPPRRRLTEAGRETSP